MVYTVLGVWVACFVSDSKCDLPTFKTNRAACGENNFRVDLLRLTWEWRNLRQELFSQITVFMIPPLKIGVHTMMWGRTLTKRRVETMLREICQVACEFRLDTLGIEFGQKTHHLGVELELDDGKRARWLAGLFQNGFECKVDGREKHVKLKLLGFSGRGALEKRVEFCELLRDVSEMTIFPEYFLIQQWFKNYADLIDNVRNLKSCLALHPFRFGPIEKIDSIIRAFREIDQSIGNTTRHEQAEIVRFLPDTAHLWLANRHTLAWILRGEMNSGEVYTKPGEPSTHPLLLDRTVAVHLKDWKKTYEPSLRYYSSGFTELGEGYLSQRSGYEAKQRGASDLEKFRNEIFQYPGGFSPWCVIEQDFTLYKEKASLSRSLRWFFQRSTRESSHREPVDLEVQPSPRPTDLLFDDRKRTFINELHQRGVERSADYVVTLRHLLRYLFDSPRLDIAVWEQSSRISTMVLLNQDERISGVKAVPSYEVTQDHCTGFRVWRLANTVGDKEQSEFWHAFVEISQNVLLPVTEGEREVDTVIWFPICNTYNFNQIEAGVGIFLNGSQLPRFGDDDDIYSIEYRNHLEVYFDDIVRNIALTLEKMWGNAAYQATSELIDSTLRCHTTTEMMRIFKEKLE